MDPSCNCDWWERLLLLRCIFWIARVGGCAGGAPCRRSVAEWSCSSLLCRRNTQSTGTFFAVDHHHHLPHLFHLHPFLALPLSLSGFYYYLAYVGRSYLDKLQVYHRGERRSNLILKWSSQEFYFRILLSFIIKRRLRLIACLLLLLFLHISPSLSGHIYFSHSTFW